MNFVLIGADGVPQKGVPNGIANTGQIDAIICIDNSGNAIQVTKAQMQSYLNGDITFDDLVLTGTLTVGGVSKFADGTVLLPGITFTLDPDSGFYRIGANNIGVSVNGVKALDIGTTGLGVTGGVTTTHWVFDNGSGAVVPQSDNTYDIGNLLSNARDIHASRAFIKKGLAATGFGQRSENSITASVTFSGGATETIAIQVPRGVKILGCQLRNDTVLAGAGATTYSAAYSVGSTAAISSGTAFSKNTKVDTFFDSNAATDITNNVTDIVLTPDAGTLDTGTVTAVVYYYELASLTDVA